MFVSPAKHQKPFKIRIAIAIGFINRCSFATENFFHLLHIFRRVHADAVVIHFHDGDADAVFQRRNRSSFSVLMPLPPSPMKKGLFIILAVVLAPVLLVGLVALAAGTGDRSGASPRAAIRCWSARSPPRRTDYAPPGFASSTKNPPNCRRAVRSWNFARGFASTAPAAA